MYFSDFRLAMVRRWYLVLFGVLVTVGLGIGASLAVPISYEARASVLLLPPKTSVENGANPYLALGGLQPAADVTARAMSDSAVVDSITRTVPGAKYAIDRDDTTNAPVVAVLAQSSSSQASLEVLSVVLTRVPQSLQSIQEDANVPKKALISSTVITRETKATPVIKSQLRAILVAVVFGLCATLFGTALIDAFMVRRRTRKALAATETASKATDERADEPPATPTPPWAEVTPSGSPNPRQPRTPVH